MTHSNEDTASATMCSGFADRKLVRICADFFALTKPGVLMLLLVSTVCPMVVASDGQPTFWLMVAALVGGAAVSGSAAAMNCIFDRDMDAMMKRTASRPLPAGRLSVTSAWIFSGALLIVGTWILWNFLNPLAAAIALFGHVFYVLVYTIWLKRTTPQNIVIGGAAGAVPPLVGWVGVRGELDFTALCFFLTIFLWTPPHFWALAMNKNEDYRRAGVPMMPTVAGIDSTVRQMWWYALSLIPVSLALAFSAENLGIFSAVTLVAMGGYFVWKIQNLWNLRNDDALRTKAAWEVFGFSIIYLALFFFFTVLDSTAVQKFGA